MKEKEHNSKMNSDRELSHESVLFMMKIALLDIRACENLEKAQTIADIFHNTPAAIPAGTTANEIYTWMFRRAELHQLGDYVKNLKELSLRRQCKRRNVISGRL